MFNVGGIKLIFLRFSSRIMAKKTPKFLGLLNFIWPIFSQEIAQDFCFPLQTWLIAPGLALNISIPLNTKTHGQMKVLILRNMGEITPKNEGNVGSHGNIYIYIFFVFLPCIYI